MTGISKPTFNSNMSIGTITLHKSNYNANNMFILLFSTEF